MKLTKISGKQYLYKYDNKEYKITEIEERAYEIERNPGKVSTELYIFESTPADKIESILIDFIERSFEAQMRHREDLLNERLGSGEQPIHFPQCKNCTNRDKDFQKIVCQIYDDMKPLEYDYDGTGKCPFFVEGDYDPETDIRYVALDD